MAGTWTCFVIGPIRARVAFETRFSAAAFSASLSEVYRELGFVP
jgi:hypothetical protein